MEKLSIIIPAHNEEKRDLGKTIEMYLEFFKEKGLDFEIFVIANDCKDNTIKIIKEKQKKNKEIRYIEVEKPGKGLAVLKGFEDAIKRNVDLIGFVDADRATLPKEFYNLVKNIGKNDGIIASRGLKESVANFTLIRKITHWGFNFIVRIVLLLPYHDTQCGAKLFKKNALKKVIGDIKTTKWAFDIDLLYNLKNKGFVVKEIPTIWEDKEGSKMNPIKVPFQMFSSVIRLRLIYSPFDFIVKLYDKLPEKIKIHSL